MPQENETSGMDDPRDGDMPPIQVMVIVVSAFQQNCSLIWDPATMRGTVVDPGGDVDRIQAAIQKQGVTVEKIVLTHGHIDHVGGAADLAEALKVPVEGPHEADRPLIDRVAEQAAQFGVDNVKPVTPDRWMVGRRRRSRLPGAVSRCCIVRAIRRAILSFSTRNCGLRFQGTCCSPGPSAGRICRAGIMRP